MTSLRSRLARTEYLETRRASVLSPPPFQPRIRLISSEKGLTGVLLLESGKPTELLEPAAEEVKEARLMLENRRQAGDY